MSFQTEEPCAACKTVFRQRTYHHVYTQKARPDMRENPNNKMPLCLEHHNMIHSKGTTYMSEQYFGVRIWLHEHKWYFCSVVKKWRLEE